METLFLGFVAMSVIAISWSEYRRLNGKSYWFEVGPRDPENEYEADD